MGLNKYAAIRYRIIDACIRSRSHPFPSLENLRQACEEALYGSSDATHISDSTIEKDLWTLRNESLFGYAPIAYSKMERGYFYTDPAFSLNLPLTVEDLSLIRLAVRTLNQFRDSKLFQDLEMAVSKIEGRISLASSFKDHETSGMIQFESAPAFKGNHLLPQLLDSIRDKQVLLLDYLPHVDPTDRSYRFHPYLLKEYKNLWYLVGLDTEGHRILTLGVDRIQQVNMTGESFLPDPDFVPADYFRYSFGIGTYSGVAEEILLEFEPVQGKYVLSQPLHPTQEVVEMTSTHITIRLKVIPSTELRMQLVGYGHQVKIRAPGWLGKEVEQIHRAALKR